MGFVSDAYREAINKRLLEGFRRHEEELFYRSGDDFGPNMRPANRYRYPDAIEVPGRVVERDESKELIVWRGEE